MRCSDKFFKTGITTLKMSLLTGFNNLLAQFLDELVKTFPELTDLKTIQTIATLMRSYNPRMILENFLSVAGRYHEKIFDEDSTFFENLENWKEDPYFKTEYGATHDDEADMFARLVVFRHVWADLTPANKEHIWTYLKQLLVIGAKASKTHTELCAKIIAVAQVKFRPRVRG